MENIITVGDIINDLKGEKRYRVVSISQHYAVLCQMDIPNLNLIEYDISTLLELKLGHEITIDHEEANWCYFCELDFRDRRKFCVIDVPRQYENLRLSQE